MVSILNDVQAAGQVLVADVAHWQILDQCWQMVENSKAMELKSLYCSIYGRQRLFTQRLEWHPPVYMPARFWG